MASGVDKVSITICGDGGCGKSSITLRLVRSQWTSEYDPTIEDSYSVTRQIDGLNYHLSLTDTAGQEEYRSLWAASNLQSDAFLLVYDITNANSLDGLTWFLEMIDIEAENREYENSRLLAIKGEKARGKREMGWRFPPIKIIAGNKCDLKDQRIVTSKTGWEWARSKGCGFMETSAREMVNIEETFALIVRRVAEARRQALDPTARGQSFSNSNSNNNNNNNNNMNINSSNSASPVGVPAIVPGTGLNSTASLPVNEKSAFEADEKRPWWKKLLCCFG